MYDWWVLDMNGACRDLGFLLRWVGGVGRGRGRGRGRKGRV